MESSPHTGAAAAPRDKRFLLARAETRALTWIAERLPARVMPDHLTALGVLAAVGIAAAYVLSNGDRAWLWAASALLVVHWLGDSLDGTLARVRRAERPRYGYYLDHVVDAFATAAIGAGIGLSPYVHLAVALAGVVAYLVLSINIYLESQVFGVFRLSYGRVGPTEARMVLVVANALLALAGPGSAVVLIADGVAGALTIGMLGMVARRIQRNLAELARLDPCPAGGLGRDPHPDAPLVERHDVPAVGAHKRAYDRARARPRGDPDPRAA